MYHVARRSSRSTSRSTTPNQEVSPTKKRKTKSQKSASKVNKTFEVLSKMADSDNPVEPIYSKQFGGIKNVKLSDTDFVSYDQDTSMPKNTSAPKSIYTGAGIKLDAFDCFHKVLNECVYDYTFSIADAALILKQLTPDIIMKIVPLMSQQQMHSPKKRTNQNTPKKPEDKTEYYEQGAIDPEVSQINIKQKGKSSTKPKTTIKRPDASRPTRMLSPGSNSCSPVSAAVQALISISAPTTDVTGTISTSKISLNEKHSSSVKSETEPKNNMLNKQTVFVPLSKPLMNNTPYTESRFVPAVVSTCLNYAKGTFSSAIKNKDILTTTKHDVFVGTHADTPNIPLTLLDCLNTQMQQTSGVKWGVASRSSEITTCTPQLSQYKSTNEIAHVPLSQDDPLPHFSLLLNTPGLSVDIPCGLPSPFQQQFSPSPVPTSISASSHSVTSIQTSTCIPNTSHLMLPQTTQQHSPSISNFISPPASLSNEQQPFLDQAQTFTHEETGVHNIRLQNQLRTILPKPESTNLTAVVTVIPSTVMSSVATVSQLSPVIKMDDKKSLQYSVPPNQIFTKMNPSNNQITQIPIVAMTVPPHRFQNQGFFFPPQTMETMLFAQQQQKDQLKQYVAVNAPLGNFKTKTGTSSDIILLPNIGGKMPTLNLPGKHESGTGNLEVASALLSMGNETKQVQVSDKQCVSSEESLEEIIQNSINGESEHVLISHTSSGLFKIDDVEIDPRKHNIKKGKFCSKCFFLFVYLFSCLLVSW